MKNYQKCKPNILVIGDLMIDSYLWGKSDRVSPEAPVPIVDISDKSEVLGGAGNVVRNLVALGANVSVASVIGDDEDGRQLKSMLEELKVDSSAILIDRDRKTTKKSRVIASNQQVIRFDSESKEDIDEEIEKELLSLIEDKLSDIDTILISDYAKGLLTKSFTQSIIKLARDANIRVLIDPKGRDYSKYKGATAITPNKKEASEASGILIEDRESLKRAGFYLKEKLELERVIITLSEEGIAIFGDEMRIIPTVAKEVYDVTGAGDTVIATLGFIRACGGDIDEAAHIANSASAVVVGKIGSATATWEEIIEYERVLHEPTAEFRIKSEDEIAKIVKRLKADKKRVVFTNGCFDILHIGHIKYLEKARAMGDILIVGLNSDESVKRLKGESRPINSEYDRAYLISALEVVDYVTIFNEDTPYELIKAIEPDILVKGGDYEGKEVVGSDIAKEVHLVDFIEGKSTSSIIEKILSKKGCRWSKIKNSLSSLFQ